MNNEIVCKYCGSPNTVKYGFVEGVQRYFCKDCRRKFSANDYLYRMKTPASQVASALNMYYSGMSIGEVCDHILAQTGSRPSTKTVYRWIEKYTQEAIDCFSNYHPKVGDTWIADETVLRIDGANVWLYDIIDADTRFMLASRIAVARTTQDARSLMEQAAKAAGKNPKVVLTDQNNSYLDGIELAYGADTEHRQGSPFAVVKEDSTSLIERFHGTLKSRTKVMRGLKSLTTAQQFADGYLGFYNFLRGHEKLHGQTPAQAAGIDCPFNTWSAVILNAKPRVEVLTTPAQTVIVSEQKPLVRPVLHRTYKTKRRHLRKRKPAHEARAEIIRMRRG